MPVSLSEPQARRQEAPPPPKSAPPWSQGLQWLRAAAALFVLLYHASVYLKIQTGRTAEFEVFGERFGLLGVAIFFAMSGFLMARLIRATEPWTFLAHRLIRIFPIYLLIVLVGQASRLAVGARLDLDPAALSLVPVGPGPNYSLFVEWTIVYETTFYALLFLVGLARQTRWLDIIAMGWLVAIAAAAVLAPELETNLRPTLWQLPLTPPCAAFAGGLLVPRLVEQRRFSVGAIVLLVLTASLASGFSIGVNRLVCGLCGVLVVGLVVAHGRPAAGRTGRALAVCGDWSYALYLLHAPLVVLIYKGILPKVSVPPTAIWALALALPLAGAAVAGPFDVALYRRLRRWIDAAPRGFVVAIGATYLAMFAGFVAFYKAGVALP